MAEKLPGLDKFASRLADAHHKASSAGLEEIMQALIPFGMPEVEFFDASTFVNGDVLELKLVYRVSTPPGTPVVWECGACMTQYLATENPDQCEECGSALRRRIPEVM